MSDHGIEFARGPSDGVPTHGGTDALGIPEHDFSTNRNACGPCPPVLAALQAAHAAQYPDPAYASLRQCLADFHDVPMRRIVIAGSASEFIHRISAHASRRGARHASVPRHSYGDYAHAASTWGLSVRHRAPDTLHACLGEGLHWACDPASPLGEPDAAIAAWRSCPGVAGTWRVLDCAYRPLRLHEDEAGGLAVSGLADVWQLWTPNKALGMTGVRAAYAIAPQTVADSDLCELAALAPSWVIGAHGVALLSTWAGDAAQRWLRQSLGRLREWKAQQIALCQQMGWTVITGHQANYFVARLPDACLPKGMSAVAKGLRPHGIKLRDASSFDLPGCVRLGVLPPRSHQALRRAWEAVCHDGERS